MAVSPLQRRFPRASPDGAFVIGASAGGSNGGSAGGGAGATAFLASLLPWKGARRMRPVVAVAVAALSASALLLLLLGVMASTGGVEAPALWPLVGRAGGKRATSLIGTLYESEGVAAEKAASVALSKLYPPRMVADTLPNGVSPGVDGVGAAETQPAAAAANEPALRVIVMTMNRVGALQRLLDSLATAHYAGDRVDVDIWVDRPAGPGGELDAAVVAASHAWKWRHGVKTVRERPTHGGLFAQWLTTWNVTESTREAALILEDDLEVSPHFWVWLKGARAAYGGRPDVGGYTTQRATLRPRTNKAAGAVGPLVVPDSHPVYLYKLVGSWGFSPSRDHWLRFLSWFAAAEADPSFRPYVKNVVMTDWYKRQEGQGTMWTMWYVRWCEDNDIYTVYANLPGGKTLASNWRESGLHYTVKKPSVDFPVLADDDNAAFVWPTEPVKLGWDGLAVGPTPL